MEILLWALVLLLLLSIGTFLWAFKSSVRWFIFYLTTDLPGPSLWTLVTRAKGTMGDNAMELLHEITESFGHKPWGCWMNSNYFVIISDWRSMTEVFRSKHTLDKPDFMYKHLGDFGPKGLFSLNGAAYKRHRKLISPAFRTDLLLAHLPRVNEDAGKMLEQLDATKGETVEMHWMPYVQAVATSVNIFFSGKYSLTADISEMARKLQILTTIVHEKSVNPIRYWLNRSNRKLEDEVADWMREIKNEFVDAKSDANVLVADDGRPANHFQVLNDKYEEEGDDRFTEEEFFRETVTLIGASFETTGTVQIACMYFLALNPDVQRRVYQEMVSIFGDSDRPVEAEDLSKMVYLEQVIKESLRICPPGPCFARLVQEEVDLNGFKAPKGSVILINMWSLHRDPEIFKDPLKFDPERFSPENCASRPQFAFAPFSGGARQCPGQVQAFMVVKTFLSHIVRNFELVPGADLASPENLKLIVGMVLRFPKLPLKFIRRHQAYKPVL